MRLSGLAFVVSPESFNDRHSAVRPLLDPMPKLRHFLLWFLLLIVSAFFESARAEVTTDQVRAELVAHAPHGLGPGKSAWLGLLIRHQPQWHTYWKNSGDSGLPTQLQWSLPEGLHAGDIQWPTPLRMVVGALANYGYEGTILLPVPLTMSDQFRGDTVTVKLKADWLVCKQECIPQSGEFELVLPVHTASTTSAALFEEAFKAQPQVLPGVHAFAKVSGETLQVTVRGLPATKSGGDYTFFAEEAGVIEHAGSITAARTGDDLILRVPLSPQRSESPATMHAVLARPGDVAGVALAFDVSGWPSMGAPAIDAEAPNDAPAFLLALALAFGGGLLLNLMPCVFPILSLKVLSFTQHAQDRKALVAGGVAYTLGAVASFVALAAALLALRASGEALGWGFQLQSPLVVIGLAILFTLIALNLAGVFEFGSVLPSGLATARVRSPILDHALTGVLAVGVASPCTAPFMGAALGAALTMPLPQALAVFAMLGLGMAAPYLLASAWPGFANMLPRPGAWMNRFKVLMAFPMLATVVWLVWVLAQQIGIDGAAAVLALLVAVAFGAWTYGLSARSRTGTRVWRATGSAVALLVAVWAWPLVQAQPAAITATASGAGVSTVASAPWQPWSEQAVLQAQAAGRPIFIDFTAAWCVTCQVNKRTTLNDGALQAEFAAKGVRLLRADWTNRDPAITQELARLGRSGVPVYALYAPGATQARLLPEILTIATVREAIAAWPNLN